ANATTSRAAQVQARTPPNRSGANPSSPARSRNATQWARARSTAEEWELTRGGTLPWARATDPQSAPHREPAPPRGAAGRPARAHLPPGRGGHPEPGRPRPRAVPRPARGAPRAGGPGRPADGAPG